MDYFSKDALTERLRQLPGIFARHHGDPGHVNRFITVEMLDDFASECPERIRELLTALGEYK